MVQLVEYLPNPHATLSLMLKIHIKMLGIVIHAYSTNTGQAQTWTPGALWPTSLAESASLGSLFQKTSVDGTWDNLPKVDF